MILHADKIRAGLEIEYGVLPLRQFPRNVLVEDFLHGQGVMTLWLRLRNDSISDNASDE